MKQFFKILIIILGVFYLVEIFIYLIGLIWGYEKFNLDILLKVASYILISVLVYVFDYLSRKRVNNET